MSEKKDKKGPQKMNKSSFEPLKIKVFYGEESLTDCMKAVMRIHKSK